ncbi:MAG: flagellar assembly protein FliW [Oscillospiraceae bacterium]|nr:flagellar assembly protein FliW [Oscillospiraceae bacterium]
MIIQTKRFGELEVAESDTWHFDGGLPGLEDYREFTLLEPSDSRPVAWLQSTEESAICLPVTHTFEVLPSYAFDVDAATESELSLSEPGQLLVLSVLIIPEDVTLMTANLAAPILVNTETRRGKQVVLSGVDYPVRYPVFEDMCRQFSAEVKR